MGENQRRKALSEAVFREVNENIETLQLAFAVAEDEPLDVVCECGRLACAERLSVRVDTYERVRSDSTLFLVLPGHEDTSIEDVVDTSGQYLVVRKRAGDPQEIAKQTDPRA
jgi:hypothetical protein